MNSDGIDEGLGDEGYTKKAAKEQLSKTAVLNYGGKKGALKVNNNKSNKPRPASALTARSVDLISNRKILESYDWSSERLLGLNRCSRCTQVVQVKRRQDQTFVAVRKITTPIPMKAWPADAHEAYREVKKLTQLKEHPNLATFRAMFEGDFEIDQRGPQPFVEMELLRKDSLNAKIQKHFELRGGFTGRQIVNYMQQLSSAVAFLHFNGILHRDVRPKNIFILKDDVLKLADVASPKIYQNRSHASRFTAAFWLAKNRMNAGPLHCCLSSPGSWPYCPPEIMCEFKKRAHEDVHVCDNKLYTGASDIWSMGVVLYETLVLKLPLFVPGVRPYSPEITDLVHRMLCLDPKERIRSKELEPLLKQQLLKIDLLQSATDGDLARIRKLVGFERVNINEQDSNGYTALMRAAENGHLDVVQYLIDQRADLLAKTRSGGTAADWAKTDDIRDLITSSRSEQAKPPAPRIRNN